MRHFLRAGWAVLGCTAFGLSAAPALAGDSNTVYIKQDSSITGVGNTIYVDQSAATGSRVGGFSTVPDLSSTPASSYNSNTSALNFPVDLASSARQLGGNNSAKITDTGVDDNISLYQNNTQPGLSGSLNYAEITLSGIGSLGGVIQNGYANTANLTVSGTQSAGGIWQQGDHNDGTVNVGGGAAALLVQNGSNNTNSLTATGAAGSQISYIVNGSNFTASAAQVLTNGAAVTITQSNAFSPLP
jgi:hypothetical protein